MEGHLREFTEAEGVTSKQLFQRLRAATESNELAKMVVSLVLSCSDYACFVDIMRAKARQRRQRTEDDGGSGDEDEEKSACAALEEID